MVVLGLDISSSSTGWAVLKNGRFYNREHVDFGWIRPPAKATLGEKLTYFRECLEGVVSKISPDVVIIEDVFFFRNPSTLKLLSRFSGVAVELCYSLLGTDPLIKSVQQLRTVLKTQGKEDTFSSIIKKFKLTWDFDSYNDVADALVAALYAHKNYY